MRLAPLPTAATIHTPATLEARRALRHDVVRRLLLEMFRGNIPAGARLITQRLSEQLGVSATPLREALVELEAIGMVEISHNRGAVAKAFGPAELAGIYQVRRVLESEAARCACGRIDQNVIEAFLDDMHRYANGRSKSAAWLRAVMAFDARFHATIAGSCGSPRLAREIDRYALLMQTVSAAIGNQRSSKQDGIREHIRILEAFRAGDPDRCADAMARHIDATAVRAQSVMFPASGGSPAEAAVRMRPRRLARPRR
jgi:DNA-binding GntR family transcriptional regulator